MTSTPRLALTELAPAQDNAEVSVNAIARALEAFATRAIVKERDNGTPPGSPAEGDAYLVPAAGTTGAWVGHEGAIALRMGGAWVYFTPKTGFVVEVEEESASFVLRGGSWVSYGGAAARLIAFFFTTTPTASEVLCLYVAAEAFTIPANMSGSQAKVGTNPTATFAVDVQKNGASIGTISISTGGVATFTTSSGTAKAIAAGDVLKFVAPASPDATIANATVNIKGIL